LSKSIHLYEVSGAMKEVLKSGGEVSFISAGFSMLPMLRNRMDKIFLVRPEGRLKKYDVPLYIRRDGKFVLHRIIGSGRDGYILRGDNQREIERGVSDEQVVAVLKAFCRDGKMIKCTDIKYRCYCRLLPFVRFFRLKIYPIYVKTAAPVIKKIKK
jgi:signal peptidase